MKKLIVLPIATLMLLGTQVTFAGNSYGCGEKGESNTSSRVITTNYEMEKGKTMKKSGMGARAELIMMNIEKRLKKLSQNQLQEVSSMLDMFEDKISSSHPNYYLLGVLQELVNEIMGDADTQTSESIVDIVIETSDVSILKDIVIELDLVDTLASEGPFTVFAPTNEAFENLLEDLDMTFEELASNPDLLRTVVLYHVVPGKITATDVMGLTQGTLVETAGGESLRVSTLNGVMIDESTVIATDIMADNGVIHLLDEVLLPPSVRETLGLPTDRGDMDVVATAIDNGAFPTLVAAIQAAGLVEALQSESPITVFAPTEEAFATLLNDLDITAGELLSDTELLTTVLTYHVIPGFYTAEDVLSFDGAVSINTLQGSSVNIDPANGSPMVNESNIVMTDVFASNGLIHVIDKVLVPSM